jgi:charged multivesicular body protein 5
VRCRHAAVPHPALVNPGAHPPCRFTMESMKETVTTVQAMKVASKELKSGFKKNKELNIDYIDNLQDDMADMMVRQQRAQHSI